MHKLFLGITKGGVKSKQHKKNKSNNGKWAKTKKEKEMNMNRIN